MTWLIEALDLFTVATASLVLYGIIRSPGR
jgi:hypothetical protein